MIRGRGLEAYEAIRGRNIAVERIENYEVDPQTLLLQFEFEEHGDEMMGIYHSHPVSVAYPSATDAWNAHYPDSIYFICSLQHDDDPVIRAFRMTPHFLEFDIASLRSTHQFYETRPGLFAFYLADDANLPDEIRGISAQVVPPLYVVFLHSDDPDQKPDCRLVSLTELPIRSA